MTTIDLDAARKARAKKRGAKKPPTIKVGGDTFSLPAEMPVAAFSPMRVGDVENYIRGLLGDEQWVRFIAHGLSLEDTEEISKVVSKFYGIKNGSADDEEATEPEAD